MSVLRTRCELMNDCTPLAVQLSAYLDGELTQQDRQQVELHLEDCPSCRKAFDELSRIRETIGRMDVPEPTEAQWSTMMRVTVTKTSRGIGWIAGIVGTILLVGFAAYQFATDDTTDALVKVGVAAVLGGLLLLFVSVAIDRLHARRSDKYKDVEL